MRDAGARSPPGDAPLTVVFETTRAGLHIEAWVPTAEGTDGPAGRVRLGGAAPRSSTPSTAGRATQADVPGGDGSAPRRSAVIAMDKYLPGQRPGEPGSDAGQNLSVAR